MPYNELKMSEYEVHWLMDFPPINSWMRQEIIMVILKANKQVKEKLTAVNRDHSDKK